MLDRPDSALHYEIAHHLQRPDGGTNSVRGIHELLSVVTPLAIPSGAACAVSNISLVMAGQNLMHTEKQNRLGH
jgi:hypothetical protein